MHRPRLSSFSFAALLAVLGGLAAHAAELSSADAADLRRAYAAAAMSTSEEPAVRAERALREPSPGFMLGAALGAWTAARDQVDFDLKYPSAAGSAHATPGAVTEAILQDCADERLAFERLEQRSRALGLDPHAAARAAELKELTLPDSWIARRAGAPSGCR